MKNFHAHTYRCLHAVGTSEDLILEAIKNGYDTLGISEHMPHISKPYNMQVEELQDYINELKALKIKYHDKIQVKIGLECEYIEGEENIYNDFFEQGIEYLILGNHFSKKYNYWFNDNIEKYYDYIKNARKAFSTGFFSYFAHPDVVYYNHHKPLDTELYNILKSIVNIGLDFDIPLEINGEGLRHTSYIYQNNTYPSYPRKEYLQLLETTKAKCIIGSDCHNPKDLYDNSVKKAYLFAKEHKLNLQDDFPIKKGKAN